MPKVETSLPRGDNSKTHQNYNHVSKKIGHEIRFKRDVDANEVSKPRRRVVKKLVRVQLHSRENDIEVTTRRPRRRVVVKKKKRRLKLSEENVPQATHHRRRVIVTKKRLLHRTDNLVDENSITPNSSIEVGVEATTSLHSEELTNSISSESVEESTEFLDGSGDNINDIEEEDEPEEDENEHEQDENEHDEDENENENENPTPQHVPDYEPFFPELSESLDAPVLLLKTTILSSIELITKTVVQSRLRTYTFIVTRVNGDEHIVTSTTEVKPQTKTTILTEPLTIFTTLTLLDFDATSTLNPLPMTPFPESLQLKNTDKGEF